MPFVPVPNTVQVEPIYMLDGQIVENTLYYQKVSAVDLSDLNNLLEAVNTSLRTGLLPLLTKSIQLLRLVGTLLDVADSLVSVSTTSLPALGGEDFESAPSNVAACMSLRTGHAGRSFRGRNYIPGIPNDAVNINTLTDTFAAAATSAYADLLAAGADLGFSAVVVSRFSGFTIVDGRKVPTPRTTGIATPITAHFFVDKTVDSQRRRLPGRGR